MMSNGSGFEAVCTLDGYIPEVALAYLTSNEQAGKVIDIRWADSSFRTYYADSAVVALVEAASSTESSTL